MRINRIQKKANRLPYSAIGKFVTTVSEVAYTIELILLESRSQFDPRQWDAGLGEDVSKLLKYVNDELLIVINESPWATLRQKQNGRGILRSIIKDFKLLNWYRNIIVHGSWEGWSEASPIVEKSSNRIRPETHFFLIPESAIRNRTKIAEKLSHQLLNVFDKYKYGSGFEMTPRWRKTAERRAEENDMLFNQLRKDLNLKKWQTHHLWRIGIRTRKVFKETGIQKIKRDIQLRRRKADPSLDRVLEKAFERLH